METADETNREKPGLNESRRRVRGTSSVRTSRGDRLAKRMELGDERGSQSETEGKIPVSTDIHKVSREAFVEVGGDARDVQWGHCPCRPSLYRFPPWPRISIRHDDGLKRSIIGFNGAIYTMHEKSVREY
jgi:hypothetical protein